MKKVGLITFHYLPNFGACLQAWALVDVLRRLDCDVSVIDYRSIGHELKFKRTGWRSLIPSWGRFRLGRFVKSHMPLTDAFRSREQVERHVVSSNYDALICGSDQIWMVDNHLGFDRTYFLDVCGIDGPRRISYAPSCGSIDSLGKDSPTIRELLLLFHSISARDCRTIRILASLGIDGVANVIDPTLLADFEPLVRRPVCEQPYIAVVGPINAAGEKLVREIGNRLGLRSVAFATRCRTADRHRRFVAPDEWLSGIAHSQFVMSSLFHGVAVSIAFRKPFLAIDAAGRSFKIQDMLQRIGLDQQLLMANDGEYRLRSNVLEMTYEHSERNCLAGSMNRGIISARPWMVFSSESFHVTQCTKRRNSQECLGFRRSSDHI